MKKILFVKSVFCPNETYFKISIESLIQNIESIMSIVSIIPKKEDIYVYLYCLGWISNFSDIFELILSYIECPFDRFFTDLWKINYGKYKIFNSIIDFKLDYDYLIYLDHDINFYSNFYDLIALSDCKIFGKSIGLIMFNQKGDNRHHVNNLDKKIVMNNIKIKWNNNNINEKSLACGAFCASYNVIKNIDKLKVISVYGLDDYNLLSNVKLKGYVNILAKNVYVFHPFDKCVEYCNWKKANVIKSIYGMNYNENIQDSINLWNLINHNSKKIHYITKN